MFLKALPSAFSKFFSAAVGVPNTGILCIELYNLSDSLQGPMVNSEKWPKKRGSVNSRMVREDIKFFYIIVTS